MAQISLESIKKIEKYRNTILDTYGRIERENPEKISQSIQLDKETAQFLVDILCKEFDIH